VKPEQSYFCDRRRLSVSQTALEVVCPLSIDCSSMRGALANGLRSLASFLLVGYLPTRGGGPCKQPGRGDAPWHGWAGGGAVLCAMPPCWGLGRRVMRRPHTLMKRPGTRSHPLRAPGTAVTCRLVRNLMPAGPDSESPKLSGVAPGPRGLSGHHGARDRHG